MIISEHLAGIADSLVDIIHISFMRSRTKTENSNGQVALRRITWGGDLPSTWSFEFSVFCHPYPGCSTATAPASSN